MTTITTGGLQQTDGGPQQLTVAGMNAFFTMVAAYKVSKAGKKRMFKETDEQLIIDSLDSARP